MESFEIKYWDGGIKIQVVNDNWPTLMVNMGHHIGHDYEEKLIQIKKLEEYEAA